MEINQDILSEIRGVSNNDSEIMEFLFWLVNFEKDHLDRDRPGYKTEIMTKLDEIIKNEIDNQKKND